MEEEVLSVHHVHPGDPTQIIKLSDKCLHPLTRLGSTLRLSVPGTPQVNQMRHLWSLEQALKDGQCLILTNIHVEIFFVLRDF